MARNIYFITAILIFFTASVTSCSLFAFEESLLRQAETAREESHFRQAISLYERHMQERLAKSSRPEWENPYFYYLLIGDMHLELNEPEKAYKMYEKAHAQSVKLALVADRYRQLAKYYEDEGDLDKASAILRKHKDLDTLLFHGMLDRLARKIVKLEEEEVVNSNNEVPSFRQRQNSSSSL